MATSTYTITPAPKFAGMQTPDCAECGHPELERAVYLAGPTGTIAVGTGCAARLLGIAEREVRRAIALDAIANAEPVEAAALSYLGLVRPGRCTAKLLATLVDRSLRRLDEVGARGVFDLWRDAYGR